MLLVFFALYMPNTASSPYHFAIETQEGGGAAIYDPITQSMLETQQVEVADEEFAVGMSVRLLQTDIVTKSFADTVKSSAKKHSAQILVSQVLQGESVEHIHAVKSSANSAVGMRAQVEVMPDAGLETIQATHASDHKDMGTTSPTLENSSSLQRPRSVAVQRAEQAEELLNSQAERREKARKIRMAAAGILPTSAPINDENDKTAQLTDKGVERHTSHTLQDMRSQAMRRAIRSQQSMRKAAAGARRMQKLMHDASVSAEEAVDLEREEAADLHQTLRMEAQRVAKKLASNTTSDASTQTAVIRPAPKDVKLSPAARRNQLKRLLDAGQFRNFQNFRPVQKGMDVVLVPPSIQQSLDAGELSLDTIEASSIN